VLFRSATKADNLKDEAADLFYHLLVLLEARDTDWREVMAVLAARAGK
jgi:phosphoribosyl-ATP pyrophosphohydrolase